MRKLLIGNVILFLHFITYAQIGTIEGKVVDEMGPVYYITVQLNDSSHIEFSAEDGSFVFNNVPLGNYTLTAGGLGYTTYSESVILTKENPSIELEILLQESTTILDEVVISGTMKEVSKLESPVPIEVYQSKFFKANPTPSIFESMQNVNGVRPQLNCNVCNTGDIHINGLEGPYTMILIDGMPIVSGLSTVYGLTGIPQSLIERVEIVKGPASTLYGSEAVGGLINIITKRPGNAPRFSADIFGTSWGEVNTDLGVSIKPTKKSESLLGLNYFNYQIPIDNNDDGFTDVTLQNRLSIFNKWSFERKNNRQFSMAARYLFEDRWGGEMNWGTENRGGTEVYGESIKTNRWEIYSTYQLPTTENLTFQVSANGHYQDSYYGDMAYEAEQYVGFGQLLWHKSTQNAHDFLVGLTYRYTFYDDNTTATQLADSTSEPSKISLPGIFVQDEITLNPTNKLLFGLRYDYNSIHGSILTPRANYKWNTANKKNIVRISLGNGYRVANVFTEDHAALTGARDVVFEDELQPERSYNANINFVKKMNTKNNVYFNIDASGFYTYFNNRIIPDYETDVNEIRYANLDGFAVSQGISSNFDVVFPSGLKLLAGATWMDVSYTEDGDRKQQILTEKFSGVWTVTYLLPKWAMEINYTGNIYSPMRLPLLGPLDDRHEYSPWWSVQNIQLTKKFKKGWEIYGGVKNILNYTPPSNSIARSFDPFDENVDFDNNGNVIPTAQNPNALTFDPSYVFAPNQGWRIFLGVRYHFWGKATI